VQRLRYEGQSARTDDEHETGGARGDIFLRGDIWRRAEGSEEDERVNPEDAPAGV